MDLEKKNLLIKSLHKSTEIDQRNHVPGEV